MSKARLHSGIRTGRGSTFNRRTSKKLSAWRRRDIARDSGGTPSYAKSKKKRGRYPTRASFGPDMPTIGDIIAHNTRVNDRR